MNTLSIDLPLVMNAAEAKQAVTTLLYLQWLERYSVSFVLPPTYQQLEPADIITISGGDSTYSLRLIAVNTLPDGRLECQAKYNAPAVYSQTSAAADESLGAVAGLALAGPTAYALLDIPLMRDEDDQPGFPVAMSGYMDGWPGGVLYRSDDSGQTWTDIIGTSSPGATLGYASNALSSHGGTVYDFSSLLRVYVYTGTLASVTEDQLFAGQNWFAYGAAGRWEIIAARTATLQSDGSYILQDLLRGQHGTAWASGLHAAGDTIVLLSAAAMNFITVNSSTINVERTYRAITSGKPMDSDADLAYTYTGVNLECLAPINLTGDRDPPTAKWTLYWTRQSRYPGWRDYVDAPLGEASESYEVDVFSDGTYTTLKRTLTSSTQTVEYSSAHQVTDFGSNQATLYLKIYQLSATVGRGYALTQSISR